MVDAFVSDAVAELPPFPCGTLLTQWGSAGSGNGQFSGLSGVATDGSGNVYVVDAGNDRIQKFDGSGHFLTTWGSPGSGNGQFDFGEPFFSVSPAGVATDGSGNVYVADFSNNRIQKFDGNGHFLSTWGSTGSGNGQFSGPGGVATDLSGNVYVVDTSNDRIQKFDASGTFLTAWGSPGSGNGQFIFERSPVPLMTPVQTPPRSEVPENAPVTGSTVPLKEKEVEVPMKSQEPVVCNAVPV
jgi:hypothetical protein